MNRTRIGSWAQRSRCFLLWLLLWLGLIILWRGHGRTWAFSAEEIRILCHAAKNAHHEFEHRDWTIRRTWTETITWIVNPIVMRIFAWSRFLIDFWILVSEVWGHISGRPRTCSGAQKSQTTLTKIRRCWTQEIYKFYSPEQSRGYFLRRNRPYSSEIIWWAMFRISEMLQLPHRN